MKINKTVSALVALAGLTTATSALNAAVVVIGTNPATSANEITTSQTWTADNEYRLVGQVYVMPGATLTIEPGTKIRSIPAQQGSLCVTRGAKIYAVGTPTQPIIFTSTNDNGTARVAASEWGNLGILGRGYISASHSITTGSVKTHQDGASAPVVNNTTTMTGLNKDRLEGLTASFTGDPRILYGGNDDNDDSGSIAYLSLRYTGKVIGVGDELNGLSLAGVGRETDVHHIDIFGGVDDGIEIWGGTVNLKYVNIWNVGDDSFDIDQGWRGQVQFGLIVQGHSADAAVGGGVPDRMFEMDGAERSDAQPQTTALFYNMTAIGQPGLPAGSGNGGGQATGWRDNVRVQIRNSIIMNAGTNVVATGTSETFAGGYGLNGTLSYADHWTTPYTEAWNTANPATGGHPSANGLSSAALQAIYSGPTTGQTAGDASIGQGFLCEITDSLFYNNLHAAAYNNTNGADAVGVTVGGASNPAKGNVVDNVNLPIATLNRGTPVTLTGGSSKIMLPVVALDPRASSAAAKTSISQAPANGFFTPAKFRGAFSDKVNWAKGWTAADEYGLFTGPANPVDPATDLFLAASTGFNTVVGNTYVVESSNDGVVWTPLTTIVGDGTFKFFADFGNKPLAAARLYRVSVQ